MPITTRAAFGLGRVYGAPELYGVTFAAFYGLFLSDSAIEVESGFGVRPVAVLRSNITIDALQKLEGVEKAPDWSYAH